MAKTSHRRRSRELATQGIYSWQMSGNAISDVEQAILEEQDSKAFDVAYFQKLLHGVVKMTENLDNRFRPHLSRPIDEIDLVEKAILRVSCYELEMCRDVPYKVIINEAIEVAKTFAADDSHKFINGVLDKSVKFIRPNGDE